MLHFVYDEVDPRTDTPFYVGITNDPNKRHAEHLRTHDLTNEAKNRHIKRLLAEGITPKMRILETVYDRREARKREQHWIQTYHKQGIHLVNVQLVKPPKSKVVTQEEWLRTTDAFPFTVSMKMFHLADEYGLTRRVKGHTTYYRRSELPDFYTWAEQTYPEMFRRRR